MSYVRHCRRQVQIFVMPPGSKEITEEPAVPRAVKTQSAPSGLIVTHASAPIPTSATNDEIKKMPIETLFARKS